VVEGGGQGYLILDIGCGLIVGDKKQLFFYMSIGTTQL